MSQNRQLVDGKKICGKQKKKNSNFCQLRNVLLIKIHFPTPTSSNFDNFILCSLFLFCSLFFGFG